MHSEFPVAFAVFAASLKRTPDEVWTIHLRTLHGRERHTHEQWVTLLDAQKGVVVPDAEAPVPEPTTVDAPGGVDGEHI